MKYRPLRLRAILPATHSQRSGGQGKGYGHAFL
jgi:hypothetical protein